MIKFPYGTSDFYKIITENYCYLDRTGRIPLLEAMGDSLLFLRPRRFGKSLLLTMLENYYDIAKAAEFARLFGALAVGRDPTPLHNQYLVMRWDFSIVTPKPTYEGQERVLTSYLNVEIANFVSKYAALLPTKVAIDEQNATASFWSLLHAVRQSDHKLYLLIDEYDNFANEVLMGNHPRSQERYEALVFGEGDFKGVFKAIKGATSGRGLDRVFIAGVSPVVLHVMERLYAHRFREMLLPDTGVRDKDQRAAEALYSQGKTEPLPDFIEEASLTNEHQAIASNPYFSTKASNLSDAPAGRLSPRSHLLTKLAVTLR